MNEEPKEEDRRGLDQAENEPEPPPEPVKVQPEDNLATEETLEFGWGQALTARAALDARCMILDSLNLDPDPASALTELTTNDPLSMDTEAETDSCSSDSQSSTEQATD